MRFEFVLLFAMTGVNLGVKYRLVLFSKYGFISLFCVRARSCVCLSVFLLLVGNLLSCVVFPMRRWYAKLWVLRVLLRSLLQFFASGFIKRREFFTVWGGGVTSVSWRSLLHSVTVLHFDYVNGSMLKWNFPSVRTNTQKQRFLWWSW